MKRKQLRKDETKGLLDRLKAFYPEPPISKKDKVELVEGGVFVVNNAPAFFEKDGLALPLLRHLLAHPATIPKVTVDMGAIKFVTSGADVMRPGIVTIDDSIQVDGPVLVVDVSHGKPLALGKALFSSGDMKALEKGKSVKILHHVGDSLWNFTL